MSRLHRPTTDAPPVRIVHLGLGNFFRAHQAWYTAHAPDAHDWGIAAFTGRSTGLADALTAQGGLYTLIVRSAGGDAAEIVGSVSRSHSGSEIDSLKMYLADPAVAVVTLTVTEAGYRPGPDSMPERLVAGLAARRAVDGGPLAVVSCDNLPDNGRVARSVVLEAARGVDPELADWIAANVSFVTTMVDRITPASTDDDRDTAARLTDAADQAPVVTEPFTEWVLTGDFPAGRPAWDAAGALFVQDISPYEERKLWLLNGGHSLLAYLGSARGHLTVAEAVADPECLGWLEDWWDLAGGYLSLPADEVADYRHALLDRFSNPRIRHLLAQIATDGSRKLPVRVLPVLQRERAAGRMPMAAVRILAGWIEHLRGVGVPVKDPDADRLLTLARSDRAEAAILTTLDPALADDTDLITAVSALTAHS